MERLPNQTARGTLTAIAAMIAMALAVTQASAEDPPPEPTLDAGAGAGFRLGYVHPPSPCSQRVDNDGDGASDYVTWYVYDASGRLTEVISDEGGDGKFEAHLTIIYDGDVQLETRLDQPVDGKVDYVTSCKTNACPSRHSPMSCPERYTCEKNDLGMVSVMRSKRGPQVIYNHYGCWEKDGHDWRYKDQKPSKGARNAAEE